MPRHAPFPEKVEAKTATTLALYQGHPTIIFSEICVPASEIVLRISVPRCQTATDLITKTSGKRLTTKEK